MRSMRLISMIAVSALSYLRCFDVVGGLQEYHLPIESCSSCPQKFSFDEIVVRHQCIAAVFNNPRREPLNDRLSVIVFSML